MIENHKVGRPQGPLAEAILMTLVQDSLTAKELAHALQISMGDAKKTCSRLMKRGVISVVSKRREVGSKKPVSVYGFLRVSMVATKRAEV